MLFVLACCLAGTDTCNTLIWCEICWSGVTSPARSSKTVLDALDAVGMSRVGHWPLWYLILGTLLCYLLKNLVGTSIGQALSYCNLAGVTGLAILEGACWQ